MTFETDSSFVNRFIIYEQIHHLNYTDSSFKHIAIILIRYIWLNFYFLEYIIFFWKIGLFQWKLWISYQIWTDKSKLNSCVDFNIYTISINSGLQAMYMHYIQSIILNKIMIKFNYIQLYTSFLLICWNFRHWKVYGDDSEYLTIFPVLCLEVVILLYLILKNRGGLDSKNWSLISDSPVRQVRFDYPVRWPKNSPICHYPISIHAGF